MSRVLLGLCDEFISSPVSTDTNFLGGQPIFFRPGISLPLCKLCGATMNLVVQLNCPLDGSSYDRIIHVFACTKKSCWNNELSWSVYRSQILVSNSTSSPTLVTNSATEKIVDSWGLCDDWGEDESSEQPNDLRGQDDNLSHSMGSLMVSDNYDSSNATHSESSERIRLESTSSSVDSSKQEMDSETAECAECTPEDLPDTRVDVDNVASLLMSYTAAGASQLANSLTTFEQYYINVIDEPYISSGYPESANSHEMELLADYAKRENVSLQELLSGHMAGVTGESYERSSAKHNDQVFVKFQKQIAACPRQIVRYSYKGSPLRVTGETLTAPSPCPRCGAPRVFELQLMPALLNVLRVKDSNETCLEFGSVHVYTCSKSCWSAADSWCSEVAVLEPDPDQSCFDRTFAAHRST